MSVLDTYNSGLEKANSIMDRFSSQFFSNKERLGRTLANVFLTIAVLMVFGCFDFLTLKFDFNKLGTIEYWTTVGSKVIAAICSFNIGINFNWEHSLAKAVELKEFIAKYELLIKQKDDGNFEYFINTIFNREQKKKAYIDYINRKIYRLNKFSRDKDKLLYSSTVPERQAQKELNKYCVKRKRLEELKSEEYIAKNLDSIKVKYIPVNPSVFSLEIDGKVKTKGIVTQGNIGVGKAKYSGTVALSMVMISMFVTSIVLSANQQQFEDQMRAFWFYLCSAVVDAGLVIWNIIKGTNTARKVISEQLTLPYAGRVAVLTAYLEWKETNNIKPTKAFEKIKELENERDNVVELTPEQIEQALKNDIKAY